MNTKSLLLASLLVTGLAGCGKAPIAASQAHAAQGAQASGWFKPAPKDRELTEQERQFGFDGFRALATETATKWDKDARLLIGGSNSVDATSARTITSGYTFIFDTGGRDRLYVEVKGNAINFAKCRLPRPLSLYPLLPLGKQKIAGDKLEADEAIGIAKAAGGLDTESFSLWMMQPKGYVDPVYYVTANKFLGMGKTVVVNAANGKVVDQKLLPFGMGAAMTDAVRALDQVELLRDDEPSI